MQVNQAFLLICKLFSFSRQKVAIYNDLAYLKDGKKEFLHPVLIKSIPAKSLIAKDDDDDDDMLILEVEVKPPQSKI